MGNNILRAWNSGFTRRWHSNSMLCDTNDPNSGHQHRCTILLLLFWPDSSRESIIDVLLHDQGEADAGDMPYPLKRDFPEIRKMVAVVEADSILEQGFKVVTTTDVESRRRRFVDLVDSFLWMVRHRPQLANEEVWRVQMDEMLSASKELGVFGKYCDLFDKAFETIVPKSSYPGEDNG